MNIRNGIWSVMLTAFHSDGSLDLEGMQALVEWYIHQGCDGLFGVCQSSEMFFLSLQERMTLARSVVRFAKGRIPVVISGHISVPLSEQVRELQSLADCGADGLVLVSNRFVASPEGEDAEFIDNLKAVLRELPKDVPLGFYECPYPFKRLLTPDVLKFCCDSGRFRFIKDTCCDAATLRAKLDLLQGSDIKLFNANTATLLESLRDGVAGYSGVMANFHPRLYKWLYENWKSRPEEAARMQDILSMCALIELKKYPACAKRYLRFQEGLPILDHTRKDAEQVPFFSADDAELAQLCHLSRVLLQQYSPEIALPKQLNIKQKEVVS